MSQLDDSLQVTLPASLKRQFDLVERRLWRVETATAVCGVAAGLIFSVLLLFLSDRFWDTPVWLRMLLLVAGVGAAAVAALEWARQWVWKRRDLRALANLVQRTHRRLGDRLLGIVELANEQRHLDNFSPALYHAAIEQVAQEAGQIDFLKSVSTRAAKRLGWMAGGLCVFLLAASVVLPQATLNALCRWAAPSANIERYTLVQLQLDDASKPMTVAHGEPFQVSGTVQYRSFWKPSLAVAKLGPLTRAEASVQSDKIHLQIPGQIENGILEVRIGDATAKVKIEPTHRPALQDISAVVQPPAYLHYPEQTESVQNGSLQTVEGSSVSFRGKVSRPLAEALMQGGGEKPAELRVQGQDFTTGLSQPMGASEYTFSWRDQLGLTNATPWRLTVQPQKDAPPVPDLPDLPRAMAMLASDVLRIRADADDDFGVRDIGLSWDVISDTPQPPVTVTESRFEMATSQEKKVEKVFLWSPQMNEIAPDSTVTLQGFAGDYYPKRERVLTASYTIRVLSPEEHAEMVRAELEAIMAQIEDITRLQEKIVSDAQSVKNAGKDMTEAQKASLLNQSTENQLQNAQRLQELAQRGESAVREAMKNSLIPEQTIRDWSKTMQQWEQLSEEKMQEAARSLQAAAQNSQSQQETARNQQSGSQSQDQNAQSAQQNQQAQNQNSQTNSQSGDRNEQAQNQNSQQQQRDSQGRQQQQNSRSGQRNEQAQNQNSQTNSQSGDRNEQAQNQNSQQQQRDSQGRQQQQNSQSGQRNEQAQNQNSQQQQRDSQGRQQQQNSQSGQRNEQAQNQNSQQQQRDSQGRQQQQNSQSGQRNEQAQNQNSQQQQRDSQGRQQQQNSQSGQRNEQAQNQNSQQQQRDSQGRQQQQNSQSGQRNEQAQNQNSQQQQRDSQGRQQQQNSQSGQRNEQAQNQNSQQQQRDSQGRQQQQNSQSGQRNEQAQNQNSQQQGLQDQQDSQSRQQTEEERQREEQQNQQELAEAVKRAEEILQALQQMEQNANQHLDQMQALTLAQRLRKVGGEEKDLSGQLTTNLADTIGLPPQELPDNYKRLNTSFVKQQSSAQQESATLQGEISRFFERTQRDNYGKVSDDMKQSRASEELDRMGGLIQSNITLQTSSDLTNWSSRFDQWADILQPKRDPSQNGQQGQQQADSQDSQGQGQQQIDMTQQLIALLRLREREMNLRDQTTAVESTPKDKPSYREQTSSLADQQKNLGEALSHIHKATPVPDLDSSFDESAAAMDSVHDLLGKPQTDSVTDTAEVKAADELSDLINLINEQAQRQQQQQQQQRQQQQQQQQREQAQQQREQEGQQRQSQASAAEEMGFLLRMMQRGRQQGAPGDMQQQQQQQQQQPGARGGGFLGGGSTDQAGRAVNGDAGGRGPATRNVNKAGGAIENYPTEFRDALENYFHGIEKQGN